jgi:hypothetical protein
MQIYEEYILAKWAKSISAKKVEQLAAEARVALLVEDIKHEFKRSSRFEVETNIPQIGSK